MILTAIAGQDRTVQPEGDLTSKICFIGEAPGSKEVVSGRPFSGPAGYIFDTCLHAAGLIRGEVYITNLFKTRVVKKRRQNRTDIFSASGDLLWHAEKGFSETGLRHVDSLIKELSQTSAQIIVPMGNPALEALTGRKGIYKWRGSILQPTYPKDRIVIPTIHPASCLQSGDYIARYYIQFDFQRAKEYIDWPEPGPPKQEMIILPTCDETIQTLLSFREEALKPGGRLAYDVEIINQEISCISFAVSYKKAISIPFTGGHFSEGQEVQIWSLIAEILEDTKIRKCNQNILFDNICLLETMKILVQGPLDDTMTACGHLYPDFPKGLDFITSVWTDNPYYKDEGKIWFKGMGTDIRKFYEYSCLDSLCAWEAMRRLEVELLEKGYTEQYQRNMDLYPVLTYLEARGIRVDREALKDVKEKLEAEAEQKQKELDAIVGEELNVKSTKQKIDYFYTKLGIKPYLKGGRPTTDEKAMVKIAKGTKNRPPNQAAKLVVEITRIRSAIEKYFNIQFDKDNRLRCSVNPRGTTTGRISTGKRIRTNTGANMQNLPSDFRQFLVADPGYVLFEIDKSQAEWVVVAYYSGDARMIEVIEKGLDAHARTGQLITGFPDIDRIREEADLLGHVTDPEEIQSLREKHFPDILNWASTGHYIPRNMPIRQCGKKSNHGGNYGMGYRRAAHEWEIPDHEAAKILPLYHQAYPGVEGSFQQGIINSLHQDRSVTNCFGRRREFLGPIDWSNRSSKVFEQAFGFIPQSTVADLINRGMIRIYNDTAVCMECLEIVGQIHDSILFQFNLELANPRELSFAIHRCVAHMNPEMEYFGRKFRIKSDLKIGKSWGSLKGVKIGQTVEGLAERLSAVLR